MAWVGCWEGEYDVPLSGFTCVVPEALASLKFLRGDSKGTISESTLQLDGGRVPFDVEGCTGWEEARTSADGDRILVEAEVKCGPAPLQRRSSALLITPAGEWLHVQGGGYGMITSAQVRRYRSVTSLAGVPEAIQLAVGPFLAEADYVRQAARRQTVSASDIGELQSMGVAEPVLDVVVAAAYPKSFAIDDRGRMTAAIAEAYSGGGSMERTPGSYYPTSGYSMLGSMGGQFYGGCGAYSFAMRYSDFCSRYGLYDPSYYYMFAGGQPGFYPGARPYYPVVVRPIESTPTSSPGGSGRLVKGSGYTQTSTGSSGTAQPRSTSGSSKAGSSAGSTQSSGSTGSSSSGSSSSSGRTAQPRKP